MLPNTYVRLPRGGLAEPRFASFPTRRLAVLPSSGAAFFAYPCPDLPLPLRPTRAAPPGLSRCFQNPDPLFFRQIVIRVACEDIVFVSLKNGITLKTRGSVTLRALPATPTVRQQSSGAVRARRGTYLVRSGDSVPVLLFKAVCGSRGRPDAKSRETVQALQEDATPELVLCLLRR
jgi:hypothetical protein